MGTSTEYEISSEQYNVKEFLNKFKKSLQPTLIKIQDGYLDNFWERGEDKICLITEIRHQKSVVLKCQKGQYVSIPVTNPITFGIVTENEPSFNQYTLSQLLEMAADFPVVSPCVLCKDLSLKDETGSACTNKMEVVKTFDEQFLYGNKVSGEKVSDRFTLLMHSPVKISIIIGLKGGNLEDHVQQLADSILYIAMGDNQGLVVYHEGLQGVSDYEYMNPGMIQKEHTKLKSWRQRKCTPPSAPDDKCNSQFLETHSPAQQKGCAAVQQCSPPNTCSMYVNIPTGLVTTKKYVNVQSANDATMSQRGEEKENWRKSEMTIKLQGPHMKVVSVPHDNFYNLPQPTSSKDEKFEIYDNDFEEKYHRELYEKGSSLMRTLRKLKEVKHQSHSMFKCPSCKKGSNHSRLYKNIKETVQHMETLFGSQSSSLLSYDVSETSDSDDVFYDANDPKTNDFEDYCRINNIEQSIPVGADNDQAKYITMQRILFAEDYVNSNSPKKISKSNQTEYVSTNKKCLTKGPNIRRSVSDVTRRLRKTLPLGTSESKNISYNTIYVDEYNKLEKQLEVSTSTLASKGERPISTIIIPENATAIIDSDSNNESPVRRRKHRVNSRNYSETILSVSDIKETFFMPQKKSIGKSPQLNRRRSKSQPRQRSKSDDQLLCNNYSNTRDVGDRKGKVFDNDKSMVGWQMFKEHDQRVKKKEKKFSWKNLWSKK